LFILFDRDEIFDKAGSAQVKCVLRVYGEVEGVGRAGLSSVILLINRAKFVWCEHEEMTKGLLKNKIAAGRDGLASESRSCF